MYRRNLPHWYPEGAAVFVTWRLFGALPPQKSLEGVKDGGAFAAIDQSLDLAQSGPAWLREPDVADLVPTSSKQRTLIATFATFIASW